MTIQNSKLVEQMLGSKQMICCRAAPSELCLVYLILLNLGLGSKALRSHTKIFFEKKGSGPPGETVFPSWEKAGKLGFPQ
jgi:hypothetical protein